MEVNFPYNQKSGENLKANLTVALKILNVKSEKDIRQAYISKHYMAHQ